MKFMLLCFIVGAAMFSLCIGGSSSEACPMSITTLHDTKCTCDSNCTYGGLRVKCSSLDQVPDDLPLQTVCLDLSQNNISSVKDELHPLKQLKYLDMSENDISEMAPDTFKHARSLIELHLNDNCLNFSNVHPKYIFSELSNLSVLHIENNKWKHISHYQDELFLTLNNLEELHMDGLPCDLQNFTAGFTNLYTLKSLNIYGGFHCISDSTFSVFQGSNVTDLYIRSGRLRTIEPFALAPFTNLRTLSLSNNWDLGFSNMSNGWCGLQYTNIEQLELQRSVPIDKEVIFLNKDFFKHLNLTHIKRLFLDRNSIVQIEPQFRTALSHLEYLSLEYNKLQQIIPLIADIMWLDNLKYLSIAQQNRQYPFVPEEPIPPMKRVLTPMISNDMSNDLNKDGTWHEQVEYLTSLHFKYGHKGILNKGNDPGQRLYNSCHDPVVNHRGLWDHHWLIPLLPHIEVINASTSLSYDLSILPVVFLLGRNSIRHIDYSDNKLEWLSGPLYFHQPNASVELFLSFALNGARYISPKFLKQSIESGLYIGGLDVSGNILGSQLHADNGDVFGAYKDLKLLNLSGNGIKILPKPLLKGTSNLVILDLSMNSLRDINFTISHLTKLKYLNLSGNLFSSFNEDIMSTLDAHISHYNLNLIIDLTGNPIVCSCDTLEFLKWIPRTPIQINQYHTYECILAGTFLTLENFYMQNMTSLEVHCSGRIIVIISVTLILAAFSSIVISIAIYRHRWDIKFFLLQMVNKRKKMQAQDDQLSFKYDAFVAFHIDDMTWVKNKLIPALENPTPQGCHLQTEANPPVSNIQKKYKLCVHHRDFLPGTVIEENIIDSINESFKTILVLTNKFVTSEWCEFELQMARIKCFDQGRDIIIVIMKDDVPASAMSKSLRALIRRTTYLEWPKTENRQPEFWERLRYSLGAPEMEPVVCECGRYVHRNRSELL